MITMQSSFATTIHVRAKNLEGGMDAVFVIPTEEEEIPTEEEEEGR